jgi:hypothetical protein
VPAAVFVQDYGDNRDVRKLKEHGQLIRSLVEEAHEKEEETYDQGAPARS